MAFPGGGDSGGSITPNISGLVVLSVKRAISNDALNGFVEDFISRLGCFGYEVSTDDTFGLVFALTEAYNHILNATNQQSIPDGLKQIYIDMACGEFLNIKYQTGQLTLSGLDFDGMVGTVTEGDTTVTFDKSASDDARFLALVNWLVTGRDGDVLCYRRIKW